MGATLHMLMSADPRAVADCCLLARPGDRVLLVDRGVDLLAGIASAGADVDLAALSPAALEADVTAAGLGEMAGKAGVQLCSDEAWVDLVCSAGRVMSWR